MSSNCLKIHVFFWGPWGANPPAFIDKLSSFKKRLIKGRLTNISKGKIKIDYRMRFPAMSRKR